MEAQFYLAKKNTNELTGFRCRSVFTNTEKSVLHYHDYYEIFLTLTNNVTHIVNNKKIVLPTNTLVFIRKNDMHYYLKSSSSSLAFINIAFNEQTLKELFLFLSDAFCSETLLNTKYPPTTILNDIDKDWLLNQITKLNSIELNDYSKIKYQSRILLFQIFTKFFSRFTSEAEYVKNNIPLWLYDLDRRMHRLENFSRGSEHMVALSGKSRDHLGRTIKKHYNQTLSEYINEIRLNYIANNLINTDTPILDICYECGFENISWAYTLFKNKYGISPLKFRNHNFGNRLL